jgi:hypothetical protein
MFRRDSIDLKSLDIMKVLGNKDSFDLFSIIAESVNIDGERLQITSQLSRKRYYGVLRKLVLLWFGEKEIHEFISTSFGQVINDLKVNMNSAVDEYYKLKAVDLIILSKGDRRKRSKGAGR